MKPVRSLVVVCGEESARFLINDGVGKGLSEVSDFASNRVADSEETRRHYGSAGVGKSGHAHVTFEPHESPDEHRRAHYVPELVGAINEAVAAYAPDRLVLAAPPKLLGALRDKLPPALRAKVSAELSRDLLKVPVGELPEHFATLAVF